MPRRFLKITKKSPAEILDRCALMASTMGERYGLSSISKLQKDGELLDKFRKNLSVGSPAGLLEYFQTRKLRLHCSLPSETVDFLGRNFQGQIKAIIDTADRICEGRFDLLGYTDLYFEVNTPNWHFDPVSGKTSPKVHWSRIKETSSEETGDKKVIWELNRHQYFSVLGQAYWLTGDEKYAETFVAHLEDWIENNPPKLGVNWLSSLEIAYRSISWIWAFYFFKDSPRFTPEVFLKMIKILYLNGSHIEKYLSTYFSPNTHLTGEALGLYLLGSFLPELEKGGKWKDIGYKILMDALDFHVREDGTYCEQSSHYHRYTADIYANLMILRQLEGVEIEQKHFAKLSKLYDFLMFATQPNGETSLFGDEDGGRFYFLDDRPISDFRPSLALGAVLLDRGDLKFAAGEPSSELFWLLGPEGVNKFKSLKSEAAGNTFRGFEAGGFFSARDDWSDGSNFILINCGEHGFKNCGHAHADALSFVLSIGGEPIFIDSGTYNYTADLEARDRFRSTSAHNCLSVNGLSSSVPDGPFSWKSIAKSKMLEWSEEEHFVRFRGTHDGFERFGVEYEREILFGKEDSVSIVDSISSRQRHSFEVNFILSPEFEAKIERRSVIISKRNSGNELQLALTTDLVLQEELGDWRIEPWMISPRYGNLVPSTRLVFSVDARGSFEIRSRLSRLQDKL